MVQTVNQELQSLFEQLQDDVIEISYRWQIIQRLFMNDEAVDTLNRTAPNFFFLCQRVFVDDMFLYISRVTDPDKSMGKDNLVISKLLEHVDIKQHTTFYNDLDKKINDSLIACKIFRTHRNKRLAHADYNVKMNYKPLELPDISINEINNAIISLQEVINTFNIYFFKTETSFRVIENGSVKALLTYLKKGFDTFIEEDSTLISGL
jgi:hypothetical protein